MTETIRFSGPLEQAMIEEGYDPIGWVALSGEAGVYDDAALRVPIVSVRLGDELPETERPRFEYLGSDTDSFARYVQVRANRNDPFYKVPAGGIDVCNVQVPIRRVPAE